MSVRVTLVRGRCRVVLVGSSSRVAVRAVVGSVDGVVLLDVVDVDSLPDVVEEGLMSVVSGGLVLVIVCVVVAADSDAVAE